MNVINCNFVYFVINNQVLGKGYVHPKMVDGETLEGYRAVFRGNIMFNAQLANVSIQTLPS